MSKLCSSILAAVLVLAGAHGARAQDAAPDPVTPPTASTEPAASPVAAPSPSPSAAADDLDLATLGIDPSAAFDDKLNLYGFADFEYQAVHFSRQPAFTTDARSFVSGNLDMYLSKNLTPRWRSLAEIRFLFAPNGSRNADGSITSTTTQDPVNQSRPIDWGGVVIERAYLEYDVTSKLTIRAGHWLSPYGIWNIDHGSPTIISTLRPYVIGEQFIPEHQTGIHAFGATYVGEYRIGYHATVSNGRSPAEATQDPDKNLAFGGRLELGAPWSGTLNLGVSAYVGRATNLAANIFAVPVSYDEVSYAADAEWHHGGLVAQSEIMARDRRYRVGQRPAVGNGFLPNGRDFGMYALAGYRTDRAWNVMPFAMYEYYKPLEPLVFTEVRDYSVGLNFRPTPTVILKGMATVGLTAGSGEYGALSTIYYYTTQAAWVF